LIKHTDETQIYQIADTVIRVDKNNLVLKDSCFPRENFLYVEVSQLMYIHTYILNVHTYILNVHTYILKDISLMS
jgi:hypothetical protein